MKKVIVTRNNYEEVMFDLLENTFPWEVEENILDQIHADTFLNFEWQQWNKARCSESTELYKTNEADFIENLTKEEKKKGLFYYLSPAAVAAIVMLLIGVSFLNNRTMTVKKDIVHAGNQNKAEGKNNKTPENNEKMPELLKPEKEFSTKTFPSLKVEEPVPIDNLIPDPSNENILVVEEHQEKGEKKEVATFQDATQAMIASAKSQPKYKITIIEENSDALDGNKYRYNEKRYSMADVLNRKDGISLSKFLENSNSRVVTDSITHRVTIEYTAEDHSVLVLTLSK